MKRGELSHEEINARLNALTRAAHERMRASSPTLTGAVGGAEIAFMTPEELAERHCLMSLLPSFAELREEARARIRARVAARKRGKEGANFQGDYRFTPLEAGQYEVHLLVNGIPCPGRMGVLTGRPGNWQAEWVDGSRVGTFDTLQDGAKALEEFRYHI